MVFDLCLVSTVTVRFPRKKGQWFQLRLLPNFHQGQVVWLKDFGFVQLFKTQLKRTAEVFILCIKMKMIYCPLRVFMNYIQVIGK